MGKITFKRFDVADHLETEQDITDFLDASAEDGDPAVMLAALAAIARARSMSQVARDAGLTREGLYKALSPLGNPAFATVAKVAGALGFRLAFQPMPTVQETTHPATPDAPPAAPQPV